MPDYLISSLVGLVFFGLAYVGYRWVCWRFDKMAAAAQAERNRQITELAEKAEANKAAQAERDRQIKELSEKIAKQEAIELNREKFNIDYELYQKALIMRKENPRISYKQIAENLGYDRKKIWRLFQKFNPELIKRKSNK